MGKPLYYLILEKNGGKRLSIKTLSIDARDFLIVRGARAVKIFNTIKGVLDFYGLKYDLEKRDGKIVMGLAGDVGYAGLIYMFIAYSARDPGSYSSLLDSLLRGEAPISLLSSFKSLIDAAVDMSLNIDEKDAVVDEGIARAVSLTMRTALKRYEEENLY